MKYQHRVLGLLSLLAIITYLDRVCIAVAGPRMQDSLHISPEAWGWVLSVFFISYSAFEIPSGILGDRIGPRRVLTRIVLWWSAFTSLTGAIHVHHGLPWSVTLRSGNLWRAMAIAACYVYALSFFQSWFQTYLVKGRGFHEVALTLSTLPYVVGAGGNLLGGYTSDLLARR